MCGILAVLGGPLPVEEPAAAAALDELTHRGPDDRGVWSCADAWLGSRRLAIIDTSPGGHQPMHDPESGATIVFNGAIYNYLELRRELERAGHTFRTASDTEVLLRAYLTWGEGCLARLNGMFAFVIWDARARRAFMARDRLGVKPFFYTLARGRLSVASEPKALLALYPELRRVDERALYDFLALGRLYTGERSFYEGIQALEPAHSATFEPGWRGPRLGRYWELPDDTGSIASAEAAERFADIFTDSVRMRLRSDVPLGITLSGGLDSTAVLHAAATADSSRELAAFTSVFDTPDGGTARDEREWAGLAAGRYARVRLEQVPAAGSDWLPVLASVARHLDGPGYSPAVASLWTIMGRAHDRGVKVILEGQGGDELLGGYPQHAALAVLARRRRPLDALRALHAHAGAFGAGRLALWLTRELVPSLRAPYRRRVGVSGALLPSFAARAADPVAAAPTPERTLAGRLAADLTRDILPGLLHYGDAVSMAHSIETRQPFLDVRLVELAVRLPDDWKVGAGESKRVLRAYLRAAGQAEIAARRDKLGFPTPLSQWLAHEGGAPSRSLLLGGDSRILAYCARGAVERLLERSLRGRTAETSHLYRLLSTELWLRECLG